VKGLRNDEFGLVSAKWREEGGGGGGKLYIERELESNENQMRIENVPLFSKLIHICVYCIITITL
jgi:hypothetical protein